MTKPIIAEPWTEEEKHHHTATARQCLRHDYKHDKPDPDNCGGCALRIGGEEGPNYAGWARIYIEAQLAIPAKWRKAFEQSAKDQTMYGNALRRSIATYGVLFTSYQTAQEAA